jgi:hypothetical protein
MNSLLAAVAVGENKAIQPLIDDQIGAPLYSRL